VDEVAIHKGHTYLTTVLDLETGRIVWAGKGRTEATLASFFAELTPKQRKSIEAVAPDMASGFRNAVEKACPHAAQVYDLYLVAKYSREVVDIVRLEEAKKQDEAGRKLIKGSRYLLLKNAPNLLTSQRKALRELLAPNKALSTVYILKDQLKRIWDYKHPAWARKALDQWCALAQESGIPALATFAKNLCRHEKGIVNHCRYPINTGRLEGHQQQDQGHQAPGVRLSRRRLLHPEDQRRLPGYAATKSAMNQKSILVRTAGLEQAPPRNHTKP